MKFLLFPILAASALTASADDDQKAKLINIGKAAYASCTACHAPDGQGLPIGERKMAPPLSRSKVVTGEPSVLALAILKGIKRDAANTEILGIMAPLEAALDDEKLAGVMTYVRNSFGNSASVVTPGEAKEFRERFKDIKAPVAREDLAETAKK